MSINELVKHQMGTVAPEPTKIHVIEGEVTLEELYKQLLLHEDIFVEVGGESEHRIRKGISSIKAKGNAKLKAADLPIDKFKIEYHVVSRDVQNETVKIRIRVTRPEVVMIKKLEVADKEMM